MDHCITNKHPFFYSISVSYDLCGFTENRQQIYWSIHVYRDAPEATGEEPEDADFDMPKIYEPVGSHRPTFYHLYFEYFFR